MIGSHQFLLVILLMLPFCSSIDDREQCFIQDSCSNSSLSSPSIYDHERFIQSRNCFCDPVCDQYGDCCHSHTTPTNYECVDFLSPLATNSTLLFNPLSIWMRTRCLSSYIGSRAHLQCRNLANMSFDENPTLFIPVTSKQTNITYRNFYCAYCNNDARSSIEFWEYKPLCHGDGSDNDYMVLKHEEQFDYVIHNLTRSCRKTILYPHARGSTQPSVFIRPCKRSVPSVCPPHTSSELAQQCSTSSTAYRYIVNSSLIYRNSYCAQCNEVNQSMITCSDPFERTAIPITQQRIRPLSILFDPDLLKRYLDPDIDNNNPSSCIVYSLKHNCSMKNQLYNLFAKKCTTISNSSRETITSMNCQYPMLTFISSGQDLVYPNGTLQLVNYSIILEPDEYVFIGDDHIVFCGDRLMKSESTASDVSSFPMYRTTITVVCASISLACLLLFAVVFWLVPSLHNLPGKCLFCLTLSLFIVQLMFITTSDLTQYSSLCFASAVIVHFAYLASFFWLVIIAIDIHSTFTSQTIQREKIGGQRWRLLAYNVFVWCSSGIIVLVACIIQFTMPKSSFSPAYGRFFCSISSPQAMILFFLVPLGCLLLIVAILFLKTVLTIHQSHMIAKLATSTSPSANNNNNSMVFVYIRLASVMGVQWLLLIVALLIGQTWSWVVFEIVNSLPGLFICIGFLCSPRLLTTLKETIGKKLILRRQQSGGSTAMTTSTTRTSTSTDTSKKALI